MRKTIVLKRNGEYEWQRFFAWHPIWIYSIDQKNGDKVELQTRVWWEWIEYRLTQETYAGDFYEYRLPISMGT